MIVWCHSIPEPRRIGQMRLQNHGRGKARSMVGRIEFPQSSRSRLVDYVRNQYVTCLGYFGWVDYDHQTAVAMNNSGRIGNPIVKTHMMTESERILYANKRALRAKDL
jgi:hypothetical protein